MLAPDPGGDLDSLRVEPLPPQPLGPGEVRVAVEAVGLNFLDVFRGIGMIDTGRLGEEMCGRVIETGAGVTTVSAGDRVAGFAFGTFGSEAVTPGSWSSRRRRGFRWRRWPPCRRCSSPRRCPSSSRT